jgi:hypothetical protein
VVEHLRTLIEGADRRKPAADHAEVEGGDAQAGDGAGQDRSTARQHARQHDAPPQGDGDVGQAAGHEEHRGVPGAGKSGAADGQRGREDVLPSGQRDPDRRDAAERRSGGAGRQTVAQAPVRWTASVRSRA